MQPIPLNFPRSPLRYPGGKTRAIKTILPFIPKNEALLCSPFLGGASIELACSSSMQVFGFDIFEPLIAFWESLLSMPDALAQAVSVYYPLSKEEFYDLQRGFLHLKNPLERAAAFYVLNRASFSGTTLSGGMSPEHPRFTLSSIQRLRDFRASNLSVALRDFQDVIPDHREHFLYLDPPYLNKQSLYGVNGDTHKRFKHETLAELLTKRERWILSYNDCKEIRDLYKLNKIISPQWNYGMSNDKSSKEILIFSRDFIL